MSYHAAIAMPRPHRRGERLPPALALPLIGAMSLVGWWLLWQVGWALVRAMI